MDKEIKIDLTDKIAISFLTNQKIYPGDINAELFKCKTTKLFL